MKANSLRALGIARAPCRPEVAQELLLSFVAAFVVPSYRDRARNLVQKPGRKSWTQVSLLLLRKLDTATCRNCEDESRPSAWPARFDQAGMYLAGFSEGFEMSIREASQLALYNIEDAVFSIVPGRLAVVMHHEWGVWLCETPNSRWESDRAAPGR